MKIHINDHRKVHALQKDFTALFPNLKMEFYGKPNTDGGTPSEELIRPGGKIIGECRVTHLKGELELTPSMTVADLKQIMNDTFGLAIAIFRREGNGWIKTIHEGKYSLEEQNKMMELKS